MRDPKVPYPAIFLNMKIIVKCYSGYRVDEKPQSIHFDSTVVQVDRIIDQWLAPDHRYFKFIGDDTATYIIRQDMNSLDWELTFFQDARKGNAGKEVAPGWPRGL